MYPLRNPHSYSFQYLVFFAIPVLNDLRGVSSRSVPWLWFSYRRPVKSSDHWSSVAPCRCWGDSWRQHGPSAIGRPCRWGAISEETKGPGKQGGGSWYSHGRPCPSFPWFFGFPRQILNKEIPWLFWCFLCLFQGFVDSGGTENPG